MLSYIQWHHKKLVNLIGPLLAYFKLVWQYFYTQLWIPAKMTWARPRAGNRDDTYCPCVLNAHRHLLKWFGLVWRLLPQPQCYCYNHRDVNYCRSELKACLPGFLETGCEQGQLLAISYCPSAMYPNGFNCILSVWMITCFPFWFSAELVFTDTLCDTSWEELNVDFVPKYIWAHTLSLAIYQQHHPHSFHMFMTMSVSKSMSMPMCLSVSMSLSVSGSVSLFIFMCEFSHPSFNGQLSGHHPKN